MDDNKVTWFEFSLCFAFSVLSTESFDFFIIV